MLLVLVYILAAFALGLGLTDRGAGRLSRIVLGAAVLVSVLYIVLDPSQLSGFSIASLAAGETHASGRPPTWPINAGRIPALETGWVQRLRDSTAGAILTRALQPVESRRAALFGFALLLLGAAAILRQPRHGLYLIVFCTLVGDALLVPWYPFTKGFSSRESLFFLHDALIVSPLEVYIVLTAIASFLERSRNKAHRQIRGGLLFPPTIAFLVFVVSGFVYGVASGGDVRIALWEARPIGQMVALIILSMALVETPAQAARLLWVAMLAVFLKGVNASLDYALILGGDLRGVESIAEHGAAIHVNALFIWVLAAWLYQTSRLTRTLLPLTIPCVLLGYIAMQRRAAFVTLAIALALTVALLYRINRRLFWIGAPALLVLGAGYVAVYWDSPSAVAVPAQAIKSVIAAQLASDKDQSSNNYRVLENRNIHTTIRQHPLAGIGFGQKFAVPFPMPDISGLFEWWEYITHNSILWIWMKAGVGGFFSLLWLIGLAVAGGVRALERVERPEHRAAVATATLFIVMHSIYACVDMSWDPRSAVLVGAMMGVVNGAPWLEQAS